MYCLKCGTELPDEAQFCIKCGANLKVKNNGKRVQTYAGKVNKCPCCGEILESFVTHCSSCGHELRDVKASSVVQMFSDKLNEIETTRNLEYGKINSNKARILQQTIISKTDKQKISQIRNFPIPNTKEDLLEFLILSFSNINYDRYNGNKDVSETEKALSDAWEAKFEQAYKKAKIVMIDSPEFNQVQSMYEQKEERKSNEKKRTIRIWVLCLVLPLVLMIGFVVFIFINDARKINEAEKELEIKLEEVYDALEDENYTLARAKALELVFSGSTTQAGNQVAEKWDKTREEILILIDTKEKEKIDNSSQETNIDDSNVSETVEEEIGDIVTEGNVIEIEDNVQMIDDETFNEFVYGFEKAEFSRYNSPASENGLDGTQIYIQCVFEYTELLDTGDTKMILGYVTDDKSNMWLIEMHIISLVKESYYEDFEGRDVVLRGTYEGYSGKKEMPIIVLDEMMDLSTGKTINGMANLLEE